MCVEGQGVRVEGTLVWFGDRILDLHFDGEIFSLFLSIIVRLLLCALIVFKLILVFRCLFLVWLRCKVFITVRINQKFLHK